MADRAAIVTGGSSGIGLAIARMLGEEGHGLTVAARRPEKLESAAAGLRDEGFEVNVVAGNLGEEAVVQEVVRSHREQFGRLDVLVNNAGVGIGAPVDEIDAKKLDLQLAINLRSVVLFYRECAELLRVAGAEHRRALVINMSSISGKSGQPWLSVYSATKAAVVGFTQAMHKELGTQGIKNTALCPGFVDTPMTDFVKEHVKARGHDPGVRHRRDRARAAEDVARLRGAGDPVPARRRVALGGRLLAQPFEAEQRRLVGVAVAHQRLVLGDRLAEVGAGALDRRPQVRLQHAQLARGRAACAAAATGEAVPRAGEGGEARATGEHDLLRAEAGEHRLARAQRQAVDGEAQVFDRRAGGSHRLARLGGYASLAMDRRTPAC